MLIKSNECLAETGLNHNPKAAKILVAEDGHSQRMEWVQMLEAEGHVVILAKDGKEAFELFVKERPDLAILDIVLSEMDGIEAAIHIRASLKDEYTPIIFITKFNDEEVLQRCIDIGCDDFIRKPFSPAIVSTKVNSLLRVKRLYQDQLEQKKKLLAYQQLIYQEQEVAATLYKNFIDAGFLKTPELKY